jgi:hypothetical protein
MTDPRKVSRIPKRNSALNQKEERIVAYRATKALPTPLPAEGLDGLVPVSDAPLAFLAFGQPEAHVARLAVRVPAVHGETDIVRDKCAVARKCEFALGSGERRRQERVAAFCAEEMLLVVSALPAKLWIIQRDETLLHDGRLAAVAPRGKVLGNRAWSEDGGNQNE